MRFSERRYSLFTNFLKAKLDTTLLEAIEILNQPNASFLVVLDKEGRLSGTLNLHELRKALMDDCDLQTPVAEVMNKKPIFAREDSDIESLSDRAGGYLPIVDVEGRVINLFVSQKESLVEKTEQNSKIKN